MRRLITLLTCEPGKRASGIVSRTVFGGPPSLDEADLRTKNGVLAMVTWTYLDLDDMKLTTPRNN